uniref:hypothetical protein n=1 Tax=uncultured Draconibacterium sp. TaxID=1573823 RepID=UPI0032175D8E
MNYTIEIDHELKIIRYKHSGIIEADEIHKAWKEFLKMEEFTILKYNLLSDYRGAKFNIKVDFLPALIEFMTSIQDIVKGKKQCIIVDDPYSTAASILFEQEVNAKVGFIVKVFTTKQAALNWLIN